MTMALTCKDVLTMADETAGPPHKPLRPYRAATCPLCGDPVPYPGRASDGSPALAECDRCDALFEAGPGPTSGGPSPYHDPRSPTRGAQT